VDANNPSVTLIDQRGRGMLKGGITPKYEKVIPYLSLIFLEEFNV
jgi:hypothetical protein